MAYNPFNIFRRNQKALFAVLTVFIMLMFTLSFGAGDAIDRFSRWLGTRSNKGEAVCTLDGESIKTGEIERVRRGRVMANTFMALAGRQAAAAAQEYANGLQGKLSPAGQQMAQQANTAAFGLSGLRMGGGDVQGARQAIAMILNADGAKSEDKDAARAFWTVLDLRERLPLDGDGNHFFQNAPNRTTRDVVEFLLWEKKADKLGIAFARDDVKVMLGREFGGFFSSDVAVRRRLQEQMAGFTMDDCLDALAVEFKVRAAQAAVLGPNGRRGPAAPVYGSPYELFEFYRQQCSPATYEVLAVPAAAYLGQVKDEPTRKELKDLYDKYANDEPNPAKEGFGFKEPRRLRVEWLAITGAEPYYARLAEEQVARGEAAARALGLGLGVPLPGVGAVPVAVGPGLREPALAAGYDQYADRFAVQRQNEYSSSATSARDLLPSSTLNPGTALAALGGALGQATPFGSPAVAAGLPLGAAYGYEVRDRVRAGIPALFAGGFVGEQLGLKRDAKQPDPKQPDPKQPDPKQPDAGAKPEALSLLVGTPGPALFQTAIGQAATFHRALPAAPPVESVREELRAEAVKARAAALAFGGRPNLANPDAPPAEKGDIARFSEELEKLSDKGKTRDPKALEAIRAYVEKFKADRGLTRAGEQFGSSTGPRDEWSMEEDPGLLPLVQAHKLALGAARGPHGGSRYIPFGRSFFWSPGPRGTRVPTAGTFLARPFPPQDRSLAPGTGQPRYVYWVSEDQAVKKAPSLTAADEQLRAVWRQIKARELAQKDAEAIAEKVRQGAASPDTVRQTIGEGWLKVVTAAGADERANRRIKRFTLDKVAPLVPLDLTELDEQQLRMMTMQGMNPFGMLVPYMLNESENIPYPALPDMAKALLDARDKPVGTALVLPDAPKDTFYVAALVKRDLKTVSEFQRSVYAPGGPARDVVNMVYQRDAVTQARQSAVELLKKEFKYSETDEQKKRLDDNAKSGGRD